jgi:hypothetical protein
MRFAAACWLSLVLACTAAAGEQETPPPGLAALLGRMAASAGVEADWRESKELALLAAPLESRGVIYFVPPDRFARFTHAPGYSALVVHGDSMRMREGRDGEAIDLSGNPVARIFVENMVVLFSGDRERLERLYEAEFLGDDDAWELRLIPRREPMSRVIEAVTLRGDTGSMREMQVDEKDGDRTITRFGRVVNDRTFAPGEIERIFVTGEPLEPERTER